MLTSLDKGIIYFEGNFISESLGQIDIAKNQHDSRENKEEALMTIQNINQIDLTQISKWIVNPSLQLQVISQGEKRIQEKLPRVERKLYTFEANQATESSGLVVKLVSRCIQCIKSGKASTSRSK